LKKDPPLTFLCLKLYWTTNPSPPLKKHWTCFRASKKWPTNNPLSWIIYFVWLPWATITAKSPLIY
jgi:hypothetical protein